MFYRFISFLYQFDNIISKRIKPPISKYFVLFDYHIFDFKTLYIFFCLFEIYKSSTSEKNLKTLFLLFH